MAGTDSSRRSIPSVDRLVSGAVARGLPRPLLVSLAREVTGEARDSGAMPHPARLVEDLQDRVDALARMRLQPVVNATGIVLHTNLGRAPLSPGALAALQRIAPGYSNLEYDLTRGTRGRRGTYAETCLSSLVGSEDALVVNNCAAALFLILHQSVRSSRPEVIVSRGDMVQIGGGFRIPEILASSGAVMREVGTTNRTSLDDYRRSITPGTGILLRVHRSNFRMEGFVESPSLSSLADLAGETGVALVYDQGTGAMEDIGVKDEMLPARALECGAALVCFSGDKLFGGPQAGLICGDADRIGTLRTNPVQRALRPDKLTIAAMEATLEDRLTASPTLPVAGSLAVTTAELRKRAGRIAGHVPDAPILIESSLAETGGGTRPGIPIPSVSLRIETDEIRPERMADRFRRTSPPVIGCVNGDRFHLDLRTVRQEEDGILARLLQDMF